jgi:uncharacterized protein YecT (DUF1311 family)
MQEKLLALTLVLALPAVAQQADEPDCDNPQTQVEMNACAYERLQEADAELNRAKATRRAAARWRQCWSYIVRLA